MGVDVRPLNPHPSEHLKSWRRQCCWHMRGSSERPSRSTLSKGTAQGCRPTCSTSPVAEVDDSFDFSTQPTASANACRFSFVFTDPQSTPRRFSFHLTGDDEHQRETPKRCRAATDVDGPNTSSLSCKKRRLRLELITSRLSQPFSLPATHILNREGLVHGDRRFAQLGTCANTVKRGLSFNASSSPFWRVALLNRTRLHIRDARLDSLGNLLSRAMVVGSTTSGASQYQAVAPHECSRRPPLASVQQFAQTLPTPAAARRARSPIPSPPASPRLRPVDLGSPYPVMADLDDEEGEAFPTVDGTMYEADDTDEVYSDFAVIFGPGSGRDEDEHSYEEYLDELDGISWVLR